MKKFKKILGGISALMGIGMIIYVVYPIISYEIQSQTRFVKFLSPLSSNDEIIYETGNIRADMTDPNNWFVGDTNKPADSTSDSKVRYYTITIPKLKIANATVTVGGEDLQESLIQYPGTAYPGRRGNAVIFGHSILPQFFNPKDYLTIFSTLPKLKNNDPIYISIDGIKYTFLVESMFEVKPTDIEILEQNLSDSFISLVTCSPPGHPLKPKRLIVKARLAPSKNYDKKLTWN